MTLLMTMVVSAVVVVVPLLALGKLMRISDEKKLAEATRKIGRDCCCSCGSQYEKCGFGIEFFPLKSHGLFARKVPGGLYRKIVCNACGAEMYYDSRNRYHDNLTRDRRGEDIFKTEQASGEEPAARPPTSS